MAFGERKSEKVEKVDKHLPAHRVTELARRKAVGHAKSVVNTAPLTLT